MFVLSTIVLYRPEKHEEGESRRTLKPGTLKTCSLTLHSYGQLVKDYHREMTISNKEAIARKKF